MKKLLVLPLFFFSLTEAFDQNIPELVVDTSPAVVNITSKREVTYSNQDYFRGMPEEFERFFGIPRDFGQQPQTRESVAYGSGFFFKENYLLTNYHVVNDATEVIVSLTDRREFKAEVIGVDMLSDLAVLKIDGKDLPSLQMGSSEELKVGDWVVAIGSPFSFDFSVTAGIVSAKGRSIQNQNIGGYVPFIQTDVAINPGNSGGPLFNLDGEVVGINSQIYSRSGGYQGVSFSIPIDVAIEVADQIIASGEVARGYLGVRMGDVDSDLAQALGMKKPYGALINSIEKDGAADNGGLKTGDVIVEFAGEEVKFAGDLPHIVGRKLPGTKSTAKVVRNGKTIKLDFILGKLENLLSKQKSRLIFGIGSGWFEQDYEEYGYEFGTAIWRLKELEKSLERIVNRMGKLDPQPKRKIPILIGGGGEKVTLRLVAQYADIWHGFATKTEERSGIETVAHKNNVLNDWCDKVGRDPNEIKRSIGIDIKRIDLADDLLEAGATEITLAVNGPGYDLTQVKEWIAWRDSK